MTTVTWKGEMAFEAVPPSGHSYVMDALPEFGGQGLGPSPLESLLCAIAACSAMDVISILKKKQQNVTSYRIEIDGDRVPEGTFPRPYTAIRVRHIVDGPELDQVAVARAVELSDTKYCSVISTLRLGPTIESSWTIGV